MPKASKKVKVVVKRKPSKQPKSRPRIGQRTTSTVNSPVFTGIRTVLGLLPGSKITLPLADFLFKSLFAVKLADCNIGTNAISSFDQIKTNTVISTSSAQSYGTAGIFFITPNMLCDTPKFPGMFSIKDTSGLNPEVVRISTNYTAVRTHRVKVTARPNGATGTQRGQWCLAFWPVTSADDFKVLAESLKTISGIAELRNAAAFSSGPAKYPLTVSYQFRPGRDGLAATPRKIAPTTNGSVIGVCAVCYEDINRSVNSEIGPADFDSSIEVSGSIQPMEFDTTNAKDFETFVWDGLQNVGCFLRIWDEKNNRAHAYTLASSGFTTVASSKSVKLEGMVRRAVGDPVDELLRDWEMMEV